MLASLGSLSFAAVPGVRRNPPPRPTCVLAPAERPRPAPREPSELRTAADGDKQNTGKQWALSSAVNNVLSFVRGWRDDSSAEQQTASQDQLLVDSAARAVQVRYVAARMYTRSAMIVLRRVVGRRIGVGAFLPHGGRLA